MSDQAVCWINGKIVPPAEATVSIFDHGFLYGDGVFEGLRFYGDQVFRLPAHLARLRRSAVALDIEMPLDDDALKAALDSVISASPLDEGYLRLIITRGVGALGIDPANCKKSSVVIISDQLNMVSDDQRDRGIKMIIASTRKNTPDRLDARIKSLNYLTPILARIEANVAGAAEAVLLNDRGFVAEGTAANIFIYKEGVLVTPPLTDGALEGITRGTVMSLAQGMGFGVEERSMTPYDLYNAHECFMTGTGARLIPVREIDGRSLEACPGEVYVKLSHGFRELIQREMGSIAV